MSEIIFLQELSSTSLSLLILDAEFCAEIGLLREPYIHATGEETAIQEACFTATRGQNVFNSLSVIKIRNSGKASFKCHSSNAAESQTILSEYFAN
jgi:hypothetical protein